MHREALWALAPLPGLPHARVGSLDVATEAISIKQGMCVAMSDKLRFDLRNPSRITGQGQCQRLILLKIGRHQLGQANRVEQARRYPPGKGFAPAGHDRKPCPERVARCRVRIEWERVEKQIGQTMAR